MLLFFLISIVQYILIPYLQYVLSFTVHLNIKTNIYLCVCECIPDSLKMGTWRGGERSLPYFVFQMVACMKIVYTNCLWIGSGFGIYLKFAHLFGNNLICIYIIE